MDEVIFSLGTDSVELWEAVATMQIMQATGEKVAASCVDVHSDLAYLFHLAGFRLTDAAPTCQLKLAEAFRTIDGAMSYDVTYQAWLARSSGLTLTKAIAPVDFPRMLPIAPKEHIVLCPFALSKLQQIPMTAWKAIARFLRTFDVDVYLLSDPGHRADGLNFTEGTMLTDHPIVDKLHILASAKLVVGMPNAWTWLASSWGRMLAIYYPNGTPTMRWYGFYNSPKHGRVDYIPHQVQIPLLLAGLRQLLTKMPEK